MPASTSHSPSGRLAQFLRAAGVCGLLALVGLTATTSASNAAAGEKNSPVVVGAVGPHFRVAHSQVQHPKSPAANRLRTVAAAQPLRLTPPVVTATEDAATTADETSSGTVETVDPPAPLPAPSTEVTPSTQATGLFGGLGDIGTNISPPDVTLPSNAAATRWGGVPANHAELATSIPGFNYTLDRSLAGSCHRPLLFSDPRVERYGHHCGCLQPLISAGQFYATFPALPYLVTAQDRCQCVPPGGSFCASNRWRPGAGGPLRVDAAVVEAVVITGLIFLIP